MVIKYSKIVVAFFWYPGKILLDLCGLWKTVRYVRSSLTKTRVLRLSPPPNWGGEENRKTFCRKL